MDVEAAESDDGASERASRPRRACRRAAEGLLRGRPVLIIVAYSLLGAAAFIALERPADEARRADAARRQAVARALFVERLRGAALDVRRFDDAALDRQIKAAVNDYDKAMEILPVSVESKWHFWNALLFCGTIYTTIGYGHIACETVSGRILCMVYAIFGIPLTLSLLGDLGKLLLKLLSKITSQCLRSWRAIGRRLGRRGGQRMHKRSLPLLSLQVTSLGLLNMGDNGVQLRGQDGLTYAPARGGHDWAADDDDSTNDPPVAAAVVATIAWLFLCAGLFCIWEDWSYFTSFYFFFVSLSTIGFGDVVPQHPQYMIMTYGFVMVGLSLMTVCFNVVKQKLELWYMAMLKGLLEDYMLEMAAGKGDAAASRDLRDHWKSNLHTRFFMPMLSKKSRQTVMYKFQEEAKASGIDLPPVLTTLDANTGLPSIIKLEDEQVDDFVLHEMPPPRLATAQVQTDEAVWPPPPPPPIADESDAKAVQLHVQSERVEANDAEMQTEVAEQATADCQTERPATTATAAQTRLPTRVNAGCQAQSYDERERKTQILYTTTEYFPNRKTSTAPLRRPSVPNWHENVDVNTFFSNVAQEAAAETVRADAHFASGRVSIVQPDDIDGTHATQTEQVSSDDSAIQTAWPTDNASVQSSPDLRSIQTQVAVPTFTDSSTETATAALRAAACQSAPENMDSVAQTDAARSTRHAAVQSAVAHLCIAVAQTDAICDSEARVLQLRGVLPFTPSNDTSAQTDPEINPSSDACEQAWPEELKLVASVGIQVGVLSRVAGVLGDAADGADARLEAAPPLLVVARTGDGRPPPPQVLRLAEHFAQGSATATRLTRSATQRAPTAPASVSRALSSGKLSPLATRRHSDSRRNPRPAIHSESEDDDS